MAVKCFVAQMLLNNHRMHSSHCIGFNWIIKLINWSISNAILAIMTYYVRCVIVNRNYRMVFACMMLLGEKSKCRTNIYHHNCKEQNNRLFKSTNCDSSAGVKMHIAMKWVCAEGIAYISTCSCANLLVRNEIID